MTTNGYRNLFLIALALVFGLTACAGGSDGSGGSSGSGANLKRLKYNKEDELRKNWNDYTVYKRTQRTKGGFQPGAVAFLYKLKDKKILMDNAWIEVTTEDEKAKTKIMESVISAEIRGHNGEVYGYLIYRSVDRARVKIIDEQTVQLSYTYVRNYRL